MYVHWNLYNKGPFKKGTTSLQRTLPIFPKVYKLKLSNIPYILFSTSERGQPPYKGQNGWSQSVLYSEVPL